MRNRGLHLACTCAYALLISSAFFAQPPQLTDVIWMRGGSVGDSSNHYVYRSDSAFSPDGKYYAVLRNQGSTIKVWRREDHQVVRFIHLDVPQQPGFRNFAFSPDGQYIAVGEFEGRNVHLIRLCDGQIVHTFFVPDGVGNGRVKLHSSLAFSPDGQYLAASSFSGTCVWRLSDYLQVSCYDFSASTMKYSQDGRYIIATVNTDINIYNVSTGSLVCSFPNAHNDYIDSAAVAPNEQYLVTSSSSWYDSYVKLWRLDLTQPSLTPVLTFRPHTRPLDVAFAPSSDRFVTVGIDSTAKIWSLNGSLLSSITTDNPISIHTVAYSPEGDILTCGIAADIWRFNMTTGAWECALHSEMAYGPVFSAASPDRRYVATAIPDGYVKIWHLLDGRFERALECDARAVEFSPSGDYLAATGYYGTKVWRTSDWGEVHSGNLDSYSLAFSPDGQYLAVGGAQNVYILNTTNWQIVRTLEQTNTLQPVCSVTFSPNSQYLACTVNSALGQVNLWRVSDWQLLHSFPSYYVYPHYPAFSPDSRYLVVPGFYDNIARMWDVETGQLVRSFRHASLQNHAVAFVNGYLMTCGEDRLRRSTLQLWDINNNTAPILTIKHVASVGKPVITNDGRLFVFSESSSFCLDSTVAVVRNPLMPVQEGDMDIDGCVDDADLLMVLFEFGETGIQQRADLNKDCVVDDADLLIVLFNFGNGC